MEVHLASITLMTARIGARTVPTGSSSVVFVGPVTSSPSPFVVPHRRMFCALRITHHESSHSTSPTYTNPRSSTTMAKPFSTVFASIQPPLVTVVVIVVLPPAHREHAGREQTGHVAQEQREDDVPSHGIRY